MLRVRGTNVWPRAIEALVFDNPSVLDYRGRLWIDEAGREQIEVAVELNALPVDAVGFIASLEAVLHNATGLRIMVSIAEQEHTTKEFKQRRWIDERNGPRK